MDMAITNPSVFDSFHNPAVSTKKGRGGSNFLEKKARVLNAFLLQMIPSKIHLAAAAILALASLARADQPLTPKAPLMGDFSKFDERARAGENLTVAFLGGSLTWGSGATDPQLTSYRAMTSKHLAEHYPKAHFIFVDAAVGGTSSNLGAFRLQRDVLDHKPDLVFIDFSVNDGPYDVDDEKLASYEALTRRVLLESGAPVELVILPVKPDLEPANRKPRPRDAKHKEVAAAYNTALADDVAYLNGEVQKGRYTTDEMWPNVPDTTHPGNKGYELYAEGAFKAFLDAVDKKQVCVVPDKMLNADTYMTWKRQRLSDLTPLPDGWRIGLPSTWGIAFDFYMSRWLYDEVIAGPGAKPFRVKFNAKTVMLFGEQGVKSGKFLVTIDGKPAVSPDSKDGMYDPASMHLFGNMHMVKVLAVGLDPSVTHTLEITPQLGHVKPPTIDGHADPEYDQEVRIESICVAGGPAMIERAP
jgi:lysophospholipase L1-like esterase